MCIYYLTSILSYQSMKNNKIIKAILCDYFECNMPYKLHVIYRTTFTLHLSRNIDSDGQRSRTITCNINFEASKHCISS